MKLLNAGMMVLATLIGLTPFSNASPTCIVEINDVEWLFKVGNRGFGPANVKILHGLTSEILAERQYHVGSKIMEHHPAIYTHDLDVEYSHFQSRDSLSKQTVSYHQVELRLTHRATHKVSTVLLARADYPIQARHRKAKLATAELFDTAQETYFKKLESLPLCQ